MWQREQCCRLAVCQSMPELAWCWTLPRYDQWLFRSIAYSCLQVQCDTFEMGGVLAHPAVMHGTGQIIANTSISFNKFSVVLVGDFPLASCTRCWPTLPTLTRYGDLIFTAPNIYAIEGYASFRVKDLTIPLEVEGRSYPGYVLHVFFFASSSWFIILHSVTNDRIYFQGRFHANATAFGIQQTNNTEIVGIPEQVLLDLSALTWPSTPVIAMWNELVLLKDLVIEYFNGAYPYFPCNGEKISFVVSRSKFLSSGFYQIFPAVPTSCGTFTGQKCLICSSTP